MFYDRKNIEPDCALDILAYRPLLKFAHWVGRPVSGNIRVVLQNYGRKPIALVSGTLDVTPNDDGDFKDEFSFDLYSYVDSNKTTAKSAISHQNHVIPANHIQTIELNFIYHEDLNEAEKEKLRDKLNHSSGYRFIIKCHDINGKTYSSKPFIKERP